MDSNYKLITDEAYQFLLNFYEQYQEDLEAIILGGSALLPYLSNYHDIDIIFIWKDYSKRSNNLRACIEFNKSFKQMNIKYSCLNWFLDQYEEAFDEHWPVYSYLFNQHQLIAGNKVPLWQEFDILKYPEKIWDTIENQINRAHNKKWFYHILTVLYILWNQSYELTEEQIININIVHDQQDQEKIEELYQWALQQIQD